MISRGYINLQHLASKWNFVDISTKNWSYQSSYHELIQSIFYHSGNITALFLDDTLELDVSIAEGIIFGILGNEKRSNQPMTQVRVCSKLNSIKEDLQGTYQYIKVCCNACEHNIMFKMI